MRFSLLFVFCLLTISCFVALNIGYGTKIKETTATISDLQSKLEPFDANLERDVRLLKLGDRPDQDSIEFMEKLKADFSKKLEGQVLAPDFTSDRLIIQHVRSPIADTVTLQQPLVLQIYVPEGWDATWRTEPFDTLPKEDKEVCNGLVLDFEEAKEFKLPSGLSKIVVTNDHNFTRYSKYEFNLNGKVFDRIKTVPPPREELPKRFFSGGMIYYVRPHSKMEVGDSKRVNVLQSAYQDLKENGEDVRPQIGFRCVIVADKSAKVSEDREND